MDDKIVPLDDRSTCLILSMLINIIKILYYFASINADISSI